MIPNSLLLTLPIVNETFLDDFVLHGFKITIDAAADWKEAEEVVLRAANVECRAFFADAKKHIEQTIRKEGLESLSVEPRVTIQCDDPKYVTLLVRVPVPARRKGRIEQAILRRFLSEFKHVQEPEA